MQSFFVQSFFTVVATVVLGCVTGEKAVVGTTPSRASRHVLAKSVLIRFISEIRLQGKGPRNPRRCLSAQHGLRTTSKTGLQTCAAVLLGPSAGLLPSVPMRRRPEAVPGVMRSWWWSTPRRCQGAAQGNLQHGCGACGFCGGHLVHWLRVTTKVRHLVHRPQLNGKYTAYSRAIQVLFHIGGGSRRDALVVAVHATKVPRRSVRATIVARLRATFSTAAMRAASAGSPGLFLSDRQKAQGGTVAQEAVQADFSGFGC